MTIEPPFKPPEQTPASFETSSVPTPPPDVPTPPQQAPNNIFDFKNMKWYEWIACIPAIILLVQGGLVGGVVGFLGWSYSLKAMRSPNRSTSMKVISVIGIILASYIGYFVIAGFILSLFSGYK